MPIATGVEVLVYGVNVVDKTRDAQGAGPTAGQAMPDLGPALYRWLAAAGLLLMFTLALSSLAQKAPTFDEQGFIVRGLAYLRGHTQIRVGHPLGLNAYNAALLVADGSVALPLDDPSWGGTSFHRPAELFLWEIGNDVEHIMLLSRLPTLWLGMLLAALAARWTGQLGRRRWAALLVLLFVALDPNVLAHARLATTDLGLAAFALLAAYSLWRYLRAPTFAGVIAAGAAMGLLQNTKFTALLFIPLLGLVVLFWLLANIRKYGRAPSSTRLEAIPWRALLLLLIVYPLTAVLVLWAGNGFDFAALPAELPALPQLGGFTLPLADYVEQLLDIGGRLQVSTPSFLLGQYSDSGWWYYFPVAFLLKTPLATLLLLLWGAVAFIVCSWRRGGNCPSALDSAALLIPSLGYFAIALTSDINLGYRHLLPVLPLLVIFAVTAVARTLALETGSKLAPLALLAAALLLATGLIYPDYLAYFNLLAGGPDGGRNALVDSNLDWGQDLDDLAPWMAAHDVPEVWLSYFGEARPEYYGIRYRGLDSFPPRLMDPRARPYYPPDPAPGIYAISATNLQGVHFADHDRFAWFREREPVDTLGRSILIYDVPASGEALDLVLAGLQMDEMAPQPFARLGTNDLRLRWVDPQQALLVPESEDARVAWPSGQGFDPLLRPYLGDDQFAGAEDSRVALATLRSQLLPGEELALFAQDGGLLLLRGAELAGSDASELVVQTAWQQQGEQRPLKLFVHVLDANGDILAQWDGLGAVWRGWRNGDTLLQVHRLPLAERERPRISRLVTGVYDPQTGRRWLSEDGADQWPIPLETSSET